MPERLKTELVGSIFQEVVERFIVSDRHTVSATLAAKFVYQLVRPILFRRLVGIFNNGDEFDRVLQRNELNDHILDLCLVNDEWGPVSGSIAPTLTSLLCFHGYLEAVTSVLRALPASNQTSLRKI